MGEHQNRGRRGRHAKAIAVAAALMTGAGCAPAAQQEKTDANLAALTQRLEETERLNSRMTVRIEELEDQVFLLQDRVETNRIAMQRRGQAPIARAEARAPGPAPETYYGAANGYGYRDATEPVTPQHSVTRIPLGAETGSFGAPAPDAAPAAQPSAPAAAAPAAAGEEEVVITEDQFKAFAAEFEAPGAPAKRGGAQSEGPRKAQPPVTDERLSTSDELEGSKPAEKPRKKVDNPLTIYKDALAAYRAGNYAEALEGFEAFLAAGPRVDYLDNALYWIGECHYGLGAFDRSVAFFQRVVREQPEGNKVPDAMLKMSLAYDRLGQPDLASATLEDLARTYPTTNAGRLGTQKLQERQKM